MSKALKRAVAFVGDGRWDRLLFRHSAYGPLLRVADVRELLRLAKLALPTDWARVARDELKRIERGEPNSLGQVSTAKRGRKR